MTQGADKLALRVASVLRGVGFVVFYVGGCVRDRLLGLETSDIDLCTDAPPSRLLELFPGSPEVGAHFGVVIVHGDEVHGEEAEVEVATFRSEHSYGDGRHPDAVAFETDPKQDVLRRDFTINALLQDPFSNEVFDYAGGKADLDAKLIRAIGDPLQRFGEDHLRMLRAVRFAARFSFDIEAGTFSAMRDMAPTIERIAPERVQGELTRILTEGGARRGLQLLDASGLLEHVLPEVERLKGVPQPPDFHPEGDVWTHTLLVLDSLGPCTPALGWAALLHDVAKPETIQFADRIRFHGHAEKGADLARRILTRLRCSNELSEAVAALVGSHMRFQDVPKLGEAAFRRFLRLPHFEELLRLHRADCLGSLKAAETLELIAHRRATLTDVDLHPAPLLRGDDLIELGYQPGPAMGEILRALEEEQLEGRLRTREAATNWVRERFPHGPQS
jgi:putative nucleotidyltransferase with HDIG domain